MPGAKIPTTRHRTRIGWGGYVYDLCCRRRFHRTVMMEHLGRPLLSTEIVHHRDHNRLNNSIENLELISRGEHNQCHAGSYGKIAPNRRLSDWEVDQIRELLRKGDLRGGTIAGMFGVSHATISLIKHRKWGHNGG